MRPRFMSSTSPNIQRASSQREFEDSLQTLKQLSRGNSQSKNSQDQVQPISWDEVAADLEAFFLNDDASKHIALD